MQQILNAMRDGSLTIAVTKKEGYYTITIIPKQNELEPIMIEGDLETVMFDLDNTNLAKAISTATDLEGIVESYKKAADKKAADLKKSPASTTPAPAAKQHTPTPNGQKSVAVAVKVEAKKAAAAKEEDEEVNLYDN